jgi:hypothetical protein
MIADMRSWPHEFISEFETYRLCLYDVKSKQYFNKKLKNSAFSKLVLRVFTGSSASPLAVTAFHSTDLYENVLVK